MAFEGVSGQGMLESIHQDYSGPLYVDGDDGAVTLRADQQDVLITHSETTNSTDAYITLPPVTEARGKLYTFYKTDSGTVSVFVIPQGWITSSLNGGDSMNWDGSTGYDLNGQHEHLVLYSTGDVWVAITDGTAGIA